MNQTLLTLSPLELKEYIDWNFMFVEWDLHGRIPEIFSDSRYGNEAKTLFDDAQNLLLEMQNKVYALYQKEHAFSRGDDIIVNLHCPEPLSHPIISKSDKNSGINSNADAFTRKNDNCKYVLPQLRNQTTHFKCLSDYVEEDSEIILFAITTKNLITDSKDDYRQLMSSIICDRLADAMLTYLEKHVATNPLSIAYGYPAAPDHSGKRRIYDILQVKDSPLNLTLTENYSMSPTSSIMGFIIQNENAEYFNVGKIGQDQIEDYAKRAGLSISRLRELIPNNF